MLRIQKVMGLHPDQILSETEKLTPAAFLLDAHQIMDKIGLSDIERV